MKSNLLVCLSVTAIFVSLTPVVSAVTSSCSAECDLCPESAPSCSASCSNRNAHGQDGSCGGRNVGCCCLSVGGGSNYLCLDTPCDNGSPNGDFIPKTESPYGDWAVVRSTEDGTEVLYASSSAFAESALNAPQELTADSPDVLTRFLFLPPGKAVGLEAKQQHRFLKGIRKDLAAQLQALQSKLEWGKGSEIFAVEVDRYRAEVLFSSDPAVSNVLQAALVDHALAADHQPEVQDPVDVFFVEVQGQEPSIFHVRYDRQP